MLEHSVMTIQFVVGARVGFKKIKKWWGQPNFDDANVGVGTTMSLILVGFYCEFLLVY